MSEFDIDGWLTDLERIYGTAIGIADELGVTAGSVSQWRKRRMIPAERQLQLHMLHPRVFTRDRLSPDALPRRLRRDLSSAAA